MVATSSRRTAPGLASDLLFEAHPSPMWVYDPATLRFLAVNRAAIDAYGYAREEFLGMTLADIRPVEDRDHLGRYLAEHTSTERRKAGLWRHLTRSGDVLWVEVVSGPLVFDGKPARIVSATDVSDRVRHQMEAEELAGALEIERSRLLEAFERSPSFMAMFTGPDHRIEVANPAYRELVGHRPLMGLTAREALPETAPTFVPVLDRVFTTGRPIVTDPVQIVVGRGSNGELDERWIRAVHQPRLGVKDEVVGVVTHGIDITEQRRAEQLQRSILAAMTEGVAVFDLEGEMIFANEAFGRILGTEDPIGLLWNDPLWDARYSDGRPVPDDERVFSCVLRLRRPVHGVHYTMGRADGTRVALVFGGAPLRDASGTMVGVVCTFADITELERVTGRLRASEERFRALNEHASDAVAILTPKGRVEYASASSRRMVGMESVPEDACLDVRDLVHPDDLDAVRNALATAESGPGESVELACRLRALDGTEVRIQGVIRNLLEHPAIRGLVVNARDVTETRALEEQLLQSQKLEAVGRLAGGVAHDFNNLLTSIVAHAEFLRMDLDPLDPMRADAGEILEAGRRAADLTRQLLAFSRKQVLEPRVLDPGSVMTGMEKLLRRVIGEDVELVLDTQEGVGAIEVDPGQLEQVLMNLAVNARDAMPQGGRLTISLRNLPCPAEILNEDLDRECVEIAVEDTGTGIPRWLRDRIFEPFFTTKEDGKGTGLGLSTVYGIVRQSGGDITVDSAVGRGTCFRLVLPRVDRTPESTSPAVDPLGLPPSGVGHTVLVVEDEDGVRSVAVRALSRAGYRVLEAANAGEALLICEGHPAPIDLIITDIVMPRMSGTELVRRLGAVRSDFRVLFMTGYTEDRVADHGVARGECEGGPVLQKPFLPLALVKKAAAVLAEV